MSGPERLAASLGTGAATPVVVPYLMAGHPSPALTPSLLLAAEEGGAAAIELGLPYSDPLADGPVIQAAGHSALRQGMNVSGALDCLERARGQGLSVPVILMGYLNPILRLGHAPFVDRARASGAQGLLVPDLPVEESRELAAVCAAKGLALAAMVAPTTTDTRLAAAARLTRGFLYCVSRTGVTGQGLGLQTARELLQRARRLTPLPLALGFGVGSRDQVVAFSGLADAVAVGTYLVGEIGNSENPVVRMRQLVGELAGG